MPGDIPEHPFIRMTIDGVLDLHTFRPAEIGDLLLDYITECRARGILNLRIIHGKGRGVARRRVAAILSRHPEVERFETADETAGGWGATLVRLKGA